MVPPTAMSAVVVLIDPTPEAREHLVGGAVATQVQAKPSSTEERPSSTVTPKASAGPSLVIFATAVVAGMDFDAYVELASRISGLPIAVTRASARGLADAGRRL